MERVVLIVDGDAASTAELRAHLVRGGLGVETTSDSLAAMEKLRSRRYAAVVVDPIIHHGLNGYAMLNYIELEKPELLSRVFLLTGMSRQTILRTAPALVPRLFRKPSGVMTAASAIIASLDPRVHPGPPQRSVLLVEDDPPTAEVTFEAGGETPGVY